VRPPGPAGTSPQAILDSPPSSCRTHLSSGRPRVAARSRRDSAAGG
jgi:hypothetical protein